MVYTIIDSELCGLEYKMFIAETSTNHNLRVLEIRKITSLSTRLYRQDHFQQGGR